MSHTISLPEERRKRGLGHRGGRHSFLQLVPLSRMPEPPGASGQGCPDESVCGTDAAYRRPGSRHSPAILLSGTLPKALPPTPMPQPPLPASSKSPIFMEN